MRTGAEGSLKRADCISQQSILVQQQQFIKLLKQVS